MADPLPHSRHDPLELMRLRAWADTVTAEDFRSPPQSPEHEAWRHILQAVAILLREGKGVSAILHMLSQVIREMEVEE